MSIRHVFLASACAMITTAFVACSSDDATTPAPAVDGGPPGSQSDATPSPAETKDSGDGPGPNDAGDKDAGTKDAGQEAGACPAYAGALPKDAGAQCHDVVSNAPTITVVTDPGTLPVGTGGTLGDGLYYLTEARLYPGSPVPPTTKLKYAVLVAGDMSYVVDDNGPTTVRRTTRKNPDGGAGIIVCETKADPNPAAGSQTATCTTLMSYDSNSKFSTKFVRQ